MAYPCVLREEEVTQANASPWKGDSTEEETRQDHIGKRGREVDDLCECVWCTCVCVCVCVCVVCVCVCVCDAQV